MRSRYDAIKALNAEVLAIAFGTEYWARAWLAETQSPFPLLLDPAREAYRAYGAEYSLVRSWNLKTVGRYVQLLLSGRSWRGIQGNSGQLGGDFIVDSSGIVRLAHPSYDPTDRPPVPQLLAALEQLNLND